MFEELNKQPPLLQNRGGRKSEGQCTSLSNSGHRSPTAGTFPEQQPVLRDCGFHTRQIMSPHSSEVAAGSCYSVQAVSITVTVGTVPKHHRAF